MFVDSHIHLSRNSFNGGALCVASEKEEERVVYLNRCELINKMKDDGIEFVLEPAVEFETNYELLKLAKEYPDFVYPAVGAHPTRCFKTKWKNRKVLDELSKDESVVAIGELGLDYHHERKRQHRFKQKLWFCWQLKLAGRRNLPLVLHIWNADDDAIKILRHYKNKISGGVCHCFNNGAKYAKIYTEEFGICLGIGGSLLGENSKNIEEAVKQTPLEYLFLESDGPYVKPKRPEAVSEEDWKNAVNTSLIIPDVAARIAKIKGIDVAEVERVTTENVKRVFNIR